MSILTKRYLKLESPLLSDDIKKIIINCCMGKSQEHLLMAALAQLLVVSPVGILALLMSLDGFSVN